MKKGRLPSGKARYAEDLKEAEKDLEKAKKKKGKFADRAKATAAQKVEEAKATLAEWQVQSEAMI